MRQRSLFAHTRTAPVVSLVVSNLLALLLLGSQPCIAAIRVVTGPHATPREQFAADRLREATRDLPAAVNVTIILAQRNSSLLAHEKLSEFWPGATEAFLLRRTGNRIFVVGSDASGVLYGALELAQRITQSAWASHAARL